MLECWIVTNPEICLVIEEFTGVSDNNDGEELPHQEEGFTSQHQFQHHVKDLTEALLSKRNPFEEDSEDLVTNDNKICESVAAAVRVFHGVESTFLNEIKHLWQHWSSWNLMLFHDKNYYEDNNDAESTAFQASCRALWTSFYFG